MKNKDSFLNKYVEYASSITDSPLPFHQFVGIATWGAILGRSRYIQFGDSQIFPNFWIMILAPSSFFRKSTALAISSKSLFNTHPQLVYPTEFSHEKILEVIQDNPTGVFYYYEFKTLMGMLSREYMMGTKAFLTEIFDNPDTYSRQTKTGSVTIERPCVNIITATTADWFVNSIKSSDAEGGFLSRFIFVYSKNKIRDDAFPPKADFNKRSMIYTMLGEMYEANKNVEAEMELSPEAKNIYVRWYHKFVSKYSSVNPSYRTMLARLNIYCLKIAIVVETCNNPASLVISAETMEESIQMSEYLFSSMVHLCESELSFSKYESQEKKIIKLLNEYNQTTRSELLKLSRLSSWEFNNIIRTLQEKDILETFEDKLDGSNRRSMMFKLKNPNQK